MRYGGAHSHAVQVVGGRNPNAGGVWAVGIIGGAEPRLQAGGIESLLDVRRLAGLAAPHRHWSFRAVEIVLNVEVVLHFSVERQYLGV